MSYRINIETDDEALVIDIENLLTSFYQNGAPLTHETFNTENTSASSTKTSTETKQSKESK